MISAPAPRIRDASVVIVRSEPRKKTQLSSADESRFRRYSEPPRQKSPSPSVNGFSAAAVAMLLLLIWSVWQWRKACAEAEYQRRQAEISWSFSDGALDQLQSMREDAKRMDADRKELISLLSSKRLEQANLQAQVQDWRSRHDELATQAMEVAGQWATHSDQLQRSLGGTRLMLSDTQEALQTERYQTTEQIHSLASEKQAVEREADAFSRKARGLEDLNSQLENEVFIQRDNLRALENERLNLQNNLNGLRQENVLLVADNAGLRNEVCSLRDCKSSLEARVRCLEAELREARCGSGHRHAGQERH